MPETQTDKTPLETLAEDFQGAPQEEAMDNLRLLLAELIGIDNTTELRLERLESRLALPDIEDEAEDAEWEPLPDLETLAAAGDDVAEAAATLTSLAQNEALDDLARKKAANSAARLNTLLDALAEGGN